MALYWPEPGRGSGGPDSGRHHGDGTDHGHIPDLARAVVEYRISALPVLDDSGFLVGIVTTFDLLRSMAHQAPVDLWS